MPNRDPRKNPSPSPLFPVLPSWPQVREAVQKGIARTQPPPPPEQFRDEPGDVDPSAIEPTMEGQQSFLPYRGTENHGVPFGSMTDGGPQGFNDGSVAVVYDEPPPPDHVVIVRLVTDAKEEIKAFRTDQSSAGGFPQAIVNRQRQRTSLKIKHLGGNGTPRVWLGEGPELTAMNGYPLDSGGEITISSTEAVYAVSNDPLINVPLAIWVDFTQDL
jgi:hypothetical protein